MRQEGSTGEMGPLWSEHLKMIKMMMHTAFYNVMSIFGWNINWMALSTLTLLVDVVCPRLRRVLLFVMTMLVVYRGSYKVAQWRGRINSEQTIVTTTPCKATLMQKCSELMQVVRKKAGAVQEKTRLPIVEMVQTFLFFFLLTLMSSIIIIIIEVFQYTYL